MITIPNQDLQKEVGITDERSYDELNVTALTNATGNRYKVEFRPSDLIYAKRVTGSGAIRVTFSDIKPGSKFATLVKNMTTSAVNVGSKSPKLK